MATLPKNQVFNAGFFESSCSTKFKKAKFQHMWSIHNFSDYCDLTETKIGSSIFTDGSINGLQWHLEMNSLEHTYLYVDLFLVPHNNFNSLEANCQLSILNEKLQQRNKIKRKVMFTKANYKVNFQLIEKSLLLNPKNQYLIDDRLTILCEIVILGNDENTSNRLALPIDLGLLLFENPDYTVITFSVNGKELYALKTILVASSPVFAAMFNHDMKENEINRIEIEDVDYEVLREMLRFLYTNKIPNLDSMADRLLIAADKYSLEHLKRKCEESMSKTLSIGNAAKYYVLAERHNVDELKNRVEHFIKNNPYEVSSASFQFISEHPQLSTLLDM